ncbi:MAG: hypothetical protein LBG90_04300 [Spirochaetaceae bacterium]|jgi:hypothetical protein|nr:hypothetical protein [Spirochaetaceae bacterium]
MTEPEKLEKPQEPEKLEKSKFALTHYIFPCLVYLQEKIRAGELTPEAIAAVVQQNALDHGHDNYKFPEDWLEQLPHVTNRYGWRIFELPKVLKEQKEQARQKRLQKKQERQEKQQQEKSAKTGAKSLNPLPPPQAGERIPSPPGGEKTESPGGAKKKIIVVKKKN